MAKKSSKKMIKEKKTGEMYSSPMAKKKHEMKEAKNPKGREFKMEYGSKKMGR